MSVPTKTLFAKSSTFATVEGFPFTSKSTAETFTGIATPGLLSEALVGLVIETTGGGFTGAAEAPKTVSSACASVPAVLLALLRSAIFKVHVPEESSPQFRAELKVQSE